MRTPRRLTAVAVLLVTALGGSLSLVTPADAAPSEGDRSVVRAADRYGVSASALRERLAEDPSLRLTSSGAAYFIDPASAGDSEPSRVVAQAFPLEDTFELHSKAGSLRTIYLDFDGHNVSGTLWNGPSGGNVPSGAHPAWDPDANGAAFSDSEKLKVQDVFQRVAEDYAPFDVDVTTEDPGLAALDRTDAGDQEYGTRTLITPSTSAATAICNNQCGGVAFVGVFNHYSGKDGFAETHEQLQPAWVFPQNLGPNDLKAIAEGATHEVGHTLGLDHDGTASQGYYLGHGGWAPIMGAAYSQPISQFSLSEYPGAVLGGPNPPPNPALQPNPDDLVTITTYGPGFRTDEAGTSTGNAGAVPTGSAYIQNRTDVDFFALGTCSGTVTVNANGAEVSPNLDIELQLLNAGNAVLDTDNPTSAFSTVDVATGMDATASATSLPSGEYYARVDGVGRGTATTGYTDYGSVGAYTLQVSGCSGGPVVTVPSAPQSVTGSYLGGNVVQLNWAAPTSNGGASITQYNIYEDGILIGNVNALGVQIGQVPSGSHVYGVAAVNSEGEGPVAEVTVDATDTPAQAKPGKTRIGKATPGKRGGRLTAKVTWRPPLAAANPAINGYQLIAYKKKSNGKYAKVSTSPVFGAGSRSAVYRAGKRGFYKFAVRARNSLGFGPLSAKSNAVRPR